MKSLYDQCAPAAIEAAAAMCGMERATAAFCNALREMPPVRNPNTIFVGALARMYLSAKLAELCKVSLDVGR